MDIKLTPTWAWRGDNPRIEDARLYIKADRAQTDGDVTVLLSEQEALSIARAPIIGLHGPRPEAVERAARSIAIALGYDTSDWRDFILHAQAALIGVFDHDNRFPDNQPDT